MSSLPTQFTGVTVHTKANVYFDGNVISHTLLLPDDTKKTLGLIRPGSYHFKTSAAEKGFALSPLSRHCGRGEKVTSRIGTQSGKF